MGGLVNDNLNLVRYNMEDQTAVLYGGRGCGKYLKEITNGKGKLSIGYEWHMKPGFSYYLDARQSNDEFSHLIENLMIKSPEECLSDH